MPSGLGTLALRVTITTAAIAMLTSGLGAQNGTQVAPEVTISNGPVVVTSPPSARQTRRPVAESATTGILRRPEMQAATGQPPAEVAPDTKSPAAAAVRGSPQPADLPGRSEDQLNSVVLDIVEGMPKGGGYAANGKAKRNFINALRIERGEFLPMDVSEAKPSFCSSATYLVFIEAIRRAEESGQVTLSADQRKLLLAGNQADGVGVWGRWNANGPGTAKLFRDLRIGRNFTDIDRALPGDFLKLWWTHEIGGKERGHSVIFLGTETNKQGEVSVRYWSSNLPDGYGEGSAPLFRVKHMLFSRFDRPSGLETLAALPPKDPYLASMLEVDEDPNHMLKTVEASPLAPQSRSTSSE